MIEKVLEFIKMFFSFWTGENYADLQQTKAQLDAIDKKAAAHAKSDARSIDDIRARALGGKSDELWPDAH